MRGTRGRLGFVLITLPQVRARAIASFLLFPLFAGVCPPTGGRFGGLLAVAVAVLHELARQSCCQYEQDTILSTFGTY